MILDPHFQQYLAELQRVALGYWFGDDGRASTIRFPDDKSKSLHLIQLKLWNIVTYHTRENPIDFRTNPSKVKVT